MNRIRENQFSEFQSYKGRQEPQAGQKVKVYKNLHNGLWSILDVKSKLVLGHVEYVSLVKCEFKVSEAGRQRVLQEQKKNVHAFVVGHYAPNAEPLELERKAYYNPYQVRTFIDRKDMGTKTPLKDASQVSMFASTSAVYYGN